jgi:hypothetical protein
MRKTKETILEEMGLSIKKEKKMKKHLKKGKDTGDGGGKLVVDGSGDFNVFKKN